MLRDDDIVPLLRGRRARASVKPLVDDRVLRQVAARHHFAPPLHATVLLPQDVRDAVGKIVLERVLARPVLLLHQRLAARAFLPTRARALVAAQVDNRGRKNVADFVEHARDERVRRLVARAEHLVRLLELR
jgi:hypothetical protein